MCSRRIRDGEVEVLVRIPAPEEAGMAEIALLEGVPLDEVYQAAVYHFLAKRGDRS